MLEFANAWNRLHYTHERYAVVQSFKGKCLSNTFDPDESNIRVDEVVSPCFVLFLSLLSALSLSL